MNERMMKRCINEIVNDLMHMHGGDKADRLALMKHLKSGGEIELGGMDRDCVRSVVTRHLIAMLKQRRAQ